MADAYYMACLDLTGRSVLVVGGGRVALEKVDGESAMSSPLAPALRALGFQEGPRRLTLTA